MRVLANLMIWPPLIAAILFTWALSLQTLLTTPEPLDYNLQSALMLICVVLAIIGISRVGALVWLSFLDHLVPKPKPSHTKIFPMVSVIVPVFNEGRSIDSALRSLVALKYPSLEIIVIDDGSIDETFDRVHWMRKRLPKARIRLLTQPNGGKASALNLGISRAQGEFVLCVDGDCIIHPDAISVALAHMSNPQVAAVAGGVKVVNKRSVLGCLQALEYSCGLALKKRAFSFANAVNIVPGPLGMFRRDALAQVGGFELDTFAEDFDLTLRLLDAGWMVVYESRVWAKTEAPETLLELSRQRYRWNRGTLQAMYKHKHLLFSPLKSPYRCLACWLMICEGIVWPIVSVLLQFSFVALTIANPAALDHVLAIFAQLLLFELSIALVCCESEGEPLTLAFWTPVSCVFYMPLLDAWRVFALFDQTIGSPMQWDSVKRLGKLS